MAALAYVLLPLSGVVAFLVGPTTRIRFHGLQAIVLGLIWAVAAYVASWVAPIATLLVFALGTMIWLALLLTALTGRDVRLPGAAYLEQVAAAAERGGDPD